MPNKPKTSQPQTPDKSQSRDFFQTPNYATELLIPFIPKKVDWVWEPAAGERKISNILVKSGYKVVSTDLADLNKPFNFLTDGMTWTTGNWSIITNPPFSIKYKFIQRAFDYNVPFAFLIPFDMCQKMAKLFQLGCQGLVPTSRIDYITPSGNQGKTSSSQFHSFWLTYKFDLPNQLTFVELTKQMKENI